MAHICKPIVCHTAYTVWHFRHSEGCVPSKKGARFCSAQRDKQSTIGKLFSFQTKRFSKRQTTASYVHKIPFCPKLLTLEQSAFLIQFIFNMYSIFAFFYP